MEFLTEYYWLALLAAALIIAIYRRGPILLILGLIAGATLPLLNFLLKNHVIDRSIFTNYHEPLKVVNVAAPLAMALGVIQMALKRSGSETSAKRASFQDTDAVRLTTLFIPRNQSNSFTRAEGVRDWVCEMLEKSLLARGIAFIEQKSNAFSPEVWLRLDYRLAFKREDVTLRASVEVHVKRWDFHRYEQTLEVVVRRGTEVVRHPGILLLDNSDCEAINRWILKPGRKLRFRNRLREVSWHFWRPKNKIKRLRPDWAGIALSAGWLPALGLMALVGVPLEWVGAVGIPAAILCAFLADRRMKRRPMHVLTSGKPIDDPRDLRWLDSWQVTVGDLAPALTKLRNEIVKRLQQGAPPDLHVNSETLGYWSVDSRVEREQICVRYRRAIGFVIVVAHGDQLYVSWECHLNQAAWAEETLGEGVDRITKARVRANRVVAGTLPLNEYDVADANFLAGWIHEAVRSELKLQMAEYKIDQEIDFTVQRESRKDALTSAPSATDQEKAKPSVGGKLRNFLRRVE